MASPSKAGAALAALREDLTGDVLAPGDPGYDDARTVFNAMIDRRPAVIAQCADEADVARSVRFARDLDLPIAVRGGGHSVAGMGLNDAGLVIDLRRMHDVTVYRAAQSVRVQGGALMSHLDRATQPYGLSTTGGRVSTTGVAGLRARRRQRLARPGPGPRRRQPPRRGPGHRRRHRGPREPRAESGPVLGPARRRRKLRRRHLAHPATARAARVLHRADALSPRVHAARSPVPTAT